MRTLGTYSTGDDYCYCVTSTVPCPCCLSIRALVTFYSQAGLSMRINRQGSFGWRKKKRSVVWRADHFSGKIVRGRKEDLSYFHLSIYLSIYPSGVSESLINLSSTYVRLVTY
jgi:hypothetical protein